MKNVFYHKKILQIGGIETFLFEIAKLYQDLDITIIYEEGNPDQIKRLKKYVRVKKYNGEKIKCNKIFFSYKLDIIDNVEAEEYIQIIHADYKAINLKPVIDKKVNKYIAVSKQVAKTFEELSGIKCDVVYNPLQIEKPNRVLNLISATRLTTEKGKDRMKKLANLLDKEQIPYIWTIFTDDNQAINNPNIIYMKPKLDIRDYIANADYTVQLSDTEGYCYTINESLSLGTPVIVTKIPSIIEMGVVDGKNGFIVDFDLSNVNIKKIYESHLKFEYEPKKDIYNKYLVKGESEYKKDLKKMVEVKCIKKYFDIDLCKEIKPNNIYKVSKARAEDLIEAKVVEYSK